MKPTTNTPLTHLFDLRRRELERHGTKIVAQALLLARRRDWHDVLVDAIPQKDFRGIDCVLLRKTVQDFIGRSTSALRHWRQRAVC